jgi:hypothetical protein
MTLDEFERWYARSGARVGARLDTRALGGACLATCLAMGLTVIGAQPAQAQNALEWSLSGFGTLGYAISDQPYKYLRYIDDDGTFQRDTVLGAQLDAKFSPAWSATLQGTIAPSMTNDSGWALRTTWAFVSWRPDNDWTLRLGKQRMAVYLNSENLDVGQTYEFARLPIEMYSLSPTTDFLGLSISRNWSTAMGDLTADVAAGGTDLTARAYARDLGAVFMPVHTDMASFVLTLRGAQNTWRLGFHHTDTRLRDGVGLPSHYPFNTTYGYYEVSGPNVSYAKHISNDILTLGADTALTGNWRLISELVRNVQTRTENGFNTAGGYVALQTRINRFSPYVSYARLRSMGAPVRVTRQLDATVLPGNTPDIQAANASQRYAADIIAMYDQSSVALGSSYAVTPQSKLKFEWVNTRIGERSAMVDAPAGSEVIRHQRINVLSLNYSFVF